MRKNILIISLSYIVYFLGSCSENKKNDCPYPTIANSKELITKDEYENKFQFDIGAKLDTYFKKIGQGQIDANVKTELNKVSEQILKSNIEYNDEFVKNWNALAIDICGKLALLDNNHLSDSSKKVLEKSILDRTIKFYESIQNHDTLQNRDILNTKKNKNNSDKKIEISIQLNDNTAEFSSALLNEVEAKISSNSTPKNPRIFITLHPTKLQTIKIITREGDTCILKGVFSHPEDLPIRFTANCLKQK